MTVAPTMISAAVGEKALGKPAPNRPDDVRKIQGLLKKVTGGPPSGLQDGTWNTPMKSAVVAFQQMWGTADGRVDPAPGQTLKRLDRLANPLELRPITLGRVLEARRNGKLTSDGGGYSISYRTCDDGPLPKAGTGYTVHLTVNNEHNAIDVTGRPANDVMSAENLGDLLAIFDRLKAWATTVSCRLQVRYRGTVISTSAPQILQTPVQPHNGVLLPLDETNNGPKLTYQGDPDAKDFHGRMFVQVPGFDKYLFVYGGRFETSNEHRGFDCITYAGTTCGASNMHMADTADLAKSLGAESITHQHEQVDAKTRRTTKVAVSLESAEPQFVKEFFAESTSGYFLMWSSGHVVLVADGEVHEFKASTPSGYACTPVLDWLEPYKTKKLTVRRLPGKPLRAK